MKRSFIALSLLFIITSCSAPKYVIGMNETDFNASKPKTVVVEATRRNTVYKRYLQLEAATMYYYFVDGKLERVERVDNQPDAVVVVKHTKE